MQPAPSGFNQRITRESDARDGYREGKDFFVKEILFTALLLPNTTCTILPGEGLAAKIIAERSQSFLFVVKNRHCLTHVSIRISASFAGYCVDAS
jgi:hypothetical protein